MYNRTIYRAASLVMTLLILMGNASPTQAAMPVTDPLQQTTGPTIYWGAMVEGKAPSSTNMQGVMNTFETLSQKKMSIIHWGQPWVLSDGSWGEFQTVHFDNVRSHGSIPMINWTSWRLGAGANQPDFQTRDVYEGKYDTYIIRWATAAKTWGHPFFLRFNHEGNGWWYPWGEGKLEDGTIVNGNSAGDFIKAWQHVHDIFVSVGATNVTWVWSLNNMGKTSQYPALSSLYPGDAYVDWTGLTAYNKYKTWTGLQPLLIGGEGGDWLKDSYGEVVSVAPNKPMMLAEFGTIEAGDGGAMKAAWITDALTQQIPINFPKLKAVVWMNWYISQDRSYPIETSQAATDAWAAGIRSSVYSANQFANLNTSPIPVLTNSTTTTVATIIPVADSYIDGARPASSAGGTSTTLYVDGSPVQTTFLKFDLSPLAGKTISSATLRFKTTGDAAAGSMNSATVKYVNDVNWKEAYLSFNNTVPISATVLGSVASNSASNSWYDVVLSPSAIQPNVGRMLSMAIQATGNDALLLYSRETVDKPQLIIKYQ